MFNFVAQGEGACFRFNMLVALGVLIVGVLFFTAREMFHFAYTGEFSKGGICPHKKISLFKKNLRKIIDFIFPIW